MKVILLSYQDSRCWHGISRWYFRHRGHGPECIPWYFMDSCWMSIDDDYDEDNSAKRYAKYYICTSKIYSCDSNISFEYGDPSYLYPCHPPFHMGRGGCGRWLPMVKWYAYHLDVLSVVLPIYILYLLPIIQLSPQIYISYIWWPDEGTFLWAEAGSFQPWTEVSMAFPNNDPATSRDN